MARPGTGPAQTSSLRSVMHPAKDGWNFVELTGSLDENADVAAVFAQLPGDSVMNMQRVERVNSMGVHRWIPLVTQFTRQHRLCIEEISYSLVQNANVVANLFGTAELLSCIAPYFCARCKKNVTVPVTGAEVVAVGGSAPAKKCAACKNDLEFDELDGYFAFFQNRARR